MFSRFTILPSFVSRRLFVRSMSEMSGKSHTLRNICLMAIGAGTSIFGAYLFKQRLASTKRIENGELLAFYLDKPSQEKLKKALSPKYENHFYDRVIIVKNPTTEETDEFKSAMTTSFPVKVLAHFHDDKHQGVLLDFLGRNTLGDLTRYPILPLSSVKKTPESRLGKILRSITGINRKLHVTEEEVTKYKDLSNFSKRKEVKLEELDMKNPIMLKEIEPWEGVLTGKTSKHRAKLEKITDLVVSGTFCNSKHWDSEKCLCKPFHQDKLYPDEADLSCPFCVYMRQGPCGDIFRKWEECFRAIEADKEDGKKPSDQTKDQMKDAAAELKQCMQKYKFYHKATLDMLNEKMKESLTK